MKKQHSKSKKNNNKNNQNKNIKKPKLLKKFGIFIVIVTTIIAIYAIYSNNQKMEILKVAISNIEKEVPSFKVKNYTCMEINGCRLNKVYFKIDDENIKIDSILISNKAIELLSGNFKNDRVAGVILLNNIKFGKDNKAPTKNISGSIIIKAGIFDNKSVIFIDFLLNEGVKGTIEDKDAIYKVTYYGNTMKNVTFKTIDSIPKITEKKVIFNKNNIKIPSIKE